MWNVGLPLTTPYAFRPITPIAGIAADMMLNTPAGRRNRCRGRFAASPLDIASNPASTDSIASCIVIS